MGKPIQRFVLLLAVATLLLGTLYTLGSRVVWMQDWPIMVSSQLVQPPNPQGNMTGNIDSNVNNRVERVQLTMMTTSTERKEEEMARLSDLDRLEKKILEEIFSEGGRLEDFVKERPDLLRPQINSSREERKERKKVVKVLVQTMAR